MFGDSFLLLILPLISNLLLLMSSATSENLDSGMDFQVQDIGSLLDLIESCLADKIYDFLPLGLSNLKLCIFMKQMMRKKIVKFISNFVVSNRVLMETNHFAISNQNRVAEEVIKLFL